MNSRLEELFNLICEYYSKAELNYQTLKEKIMNEINKINNLIISCEEITIETIINKYNEIKNKFQKIEDIQNIAKNDIPINNVTFNGVDNPFILETKIENYYVNNKISIELLYDDNTKTPKVRSRLENNIQPKLYNLDFYSRIGQKDKIGKKILLSLNNITSYIDILFDSGTNKAKIIKNFYFDEYNYDIVQYEEKKNTTKKIIRGIEIPITITISNNNISKEHITIDPMNKTTIEDYEF